MGLAERRAAKEFETNVFPGLKAEVTKAAGFELPIEIDWESLQKTETSPDYYRESWTKVYFTPMVDALKAIGVDDMGKEALKALKKIVIHNKHDIYYGDRWASFDKPSGVLTLDHQPTSNVDNIDERAKGLQKELEDKL